MAEITAATVKELRERTGAGMMDCKKALGETNGDMEAAIDWLRTKGLAAAAKKAGRTAAEGLVGVAVDGTSGAVVEVNSRDRLRRQERAVPGFRPHRRRRSRSATGGDVEALQRAALSGRRHRRGEADRQHRHDRREPVAAPRRRARGRRGRGRLLRPQCRRARASARSACWSRSRARADADALEALGKQLAMHIAAANPLALTRRGARSGAGRARARHRHGEGRAKAASRPRSSRRWSKARSPSSARRMRCCRSCSSSTTRPRSRTSSPPRPRTPARRSRSRRYVRFQLGEGIEKKESDFAAEVAAAAGRQQARAGRLTCRDAVRQLADGAGAP